MGMAGSGLSDKNVRLRFFTYIFMGILALGSVLYWKTQLLRNSEYVDLEAYDHKKKKEDPSVLKSNNYQIEPIETNPTAK